MAEVALLLHDLGHSFDDEVNILVDSAFSESGEVAFFDDDVVLEVDVEGHVIGEEPDVAFKFMVAKQTCRDYHPVNVELSNRALLEVADERKELLAPDEIRVDSI